MIFDYGFWIMDGRRGRGARILDFELWILNGRVLKFGALGVLAVNLFFRCFGCQCFGMRKKISKRRAAILNL
jgi:hypothetical protein